MKKKTVVATTVGLAVGTGLGMMYAPKKGKELRQDIKKELKIVLDKIKKMDVKDMTMSLEKTIHKIEKDLEALDKEKVKKKAEKKAQEIKNQIEDLINTAKEKKDTLIEDAANELKEKATKVTKQILNKLED